MEGTEELPPPAYSKDIVDCISLLWIFGDSRVDAEMCP